MIDCRPRQAADVELSQRRQGFGLLPFEFENVATVTVAHATAKLAGPDRIIRQVIAEKTFELGDHFAAEGTIDVPVAVAPFAGGDVPVGGQ